MADEDLFAPSKTCNRCKEDLPLSSFGKWHRSPDGLSRVCRKCMALYNKESRARNWGKEYGMMILNREVNRIPAYRAAKAATDAMAEQLKKDLGIK